jgi:hypothetical protein
MTAQVLRQHAGRSRIVRDVQYPRGALAGGRVAAAEHRGAARAEDPGLLAAMASSVVAEVLLMIEADAHHHGDVRIDHVDGIEAPAHADLEHPGIEPRRLEHQQRRQRVVLEERQADLAARRLDALERRDQLLRRDQPS